MNIRITYLEPGVVGHTFVHIVGQGSCQDTSVEHLGVLAENLDSSSLGHHDRDLGSHSGSRPALLEDEHCQE